MRPFTLAHSAAALLAFILGVEGCSSDDAPAATSPLPGAPAPGPSSSGTPAPTDPPKPVLDPLGPEFVNLGDVAQEFPLDVPQGTLGFALEPLGTATVVRVRDPNGKLYDHTSDPVGLREDYTRLTRFPENSTRFDVPPGTWTITLSEATGMRVARQRTSDGKFHGGILNLFVYLPTGVHAEDLFTSVVPGEVVTAATAENNPVIRGLVDTFFGQVKRLLDFDRGKVTFADVDARFLKIDESDLEDASKVASRSGNTDLGLHILLTESILLGGEQANGVSLGTWATSYDRINNAVMVNLHDTEQGAKLSDLPGTGYLPADSPALAMIHEGLHHWGIPHTSDVTIAPYDDGFTDTPRCPPTTDPVVRGQCPDLTNLMFPFEAKPVVTAILSPHQKAVIQATSVYHPYGPPK